MFPTCDQIQRAAYERWLRRGRIHGRDREDWYAAEKELTFHGNYRTIAAYALDSDGRVVVGDGPIRRCRFCERTSGQTAFGPPPPVVPRPVGNGSLRTPAICDECQADCRDPLEDDFRTLWSGLQAGGTTRDGLSDSRRRNLYSVAAFKSLVAGALLLLPESELGYFPDALEWVSNPDQDTDVRLFAESSCRIYSGDFLRGRPWTSLARRVDDETSLPYLLYFLAADGLVIQIHVPLCLRDEDLDGRRLRMPERVFEAGEGPDFRESHSTVLPLALQRREAAALSSLHAFG
jgi:hypothetical protein